MWPPNAFKPPLAKAGGHGLRPTVSTQSLCFPTFSRKSNISPNKKLSTNRAMHLNMLWIVENKTWSITQFEHEAKHESKT